MSPRQLASACILALFALVLAWHLWLAPPLRVPAMVAAALHASPLLPALLLLLRGHRAAPFWGAVAALFLFCHGVSEAWSAPRVRALALVEILLSVVLVVSASWRGLRARFARKGGV
jgi:uncharacterized membrane protein